MVTDVQFNSVWYAETIRSEFAGQFTSNNAMEFIVGLFGKPVWKQLFLQGFFGDISCTEMTHFTFKLQATQTSYINTLGKYIYGQINWYENKDGHC